MIYDLALCSTRVSNELGAGRPWAARLAVHVVMFLAILEGIVMAAAVVRVRYVWGHAYSNEEEVVTYVARMLVVISVANFLDGIQCVLSGSYITKDLILSFYNIYIYIYAVYLRDGQGSNVTHVYI